MLCCDEVRLCVEALRSCILSFNSSIILFRSPEDVIHVESEVLTSIVGTVLVRFTRIVLFLLYGYNMTFIYLFLLFSLGFLLFSW